MSLFPSSPTWRRRCAALACVVACGAYAPRTIAADWQHVWNTGDAPVIRLALGERHAYAWALQPLRAIGRSEGGALWVALPSERRQEIYGISVAPNVPTRVWIAAASSVPSLTGVLVSEDAGRTFSPRPTPVSDQEVIAITAVPGQPDTVLIGTNPFSYPSPINGLSAPGGVFRSTDGGHTWEPAGLQGLAVREFVIDPHDPESMYVSAYSDEVKRDTTYRSRDGGRTWEHFVAMRLRSLHVDPHERRRLMARSSSGPWECLIRSDDAGGTWRIQWTKPLILESSEAKPVIIDALVADPRLPGVLYIGTAGHGVHRSTDDGETWQPLGLDELAINEMAIDPSGEFLYVATQPRGASGKGKSGVYRLADPSGDPALLPWFTVDRDTVPLGIAVTFTDATRGAVVTRSWDFGDGTTSSEASPAHVFAKWGTYSVTLTVSDTSETKAISRTVVVEPTRARPVRAGNAGRASTPAPRSTDPGN